MTLFSISNIIALSLPTGISIRILVMFTALSFLGLVYLGKYILSHS
jgi:hypothetical protein